MKAVELVEEAWVEGGADALLKALDDDGHVFSAVGGEGIAQFRREAVEAVVHRVHVHVEVGELGGVAAVDAAAFLGNEG